MSRISWHSVVRERTDESLELILDQVADTSPFLGFFDVAGAGDVFGTEVEVPDFTGDTRFADIGFWNIEHFNERVSDDRVERVADTVAQLSMDVLGLTEVQKPALDRLVEALGRRGLAYDFVLENVRGSQDLALLFDRETTTAVEQEIPLRLARKLGARTASGKTVFPRRPLFAHCRVHEDGGDTEFIVIVVHLKAFGDAESRERRRLAAEILAEIIADIREREELPVVLGGDFNDRLNTDVLRPLQDSQDLFALTADDAQSGAISFVGSNHRSLIDHIIVSRDVTAGDIAGDDAAIVRLDRSVAGFADDVSDHVPVVFRLVYRDVPVPVATPGADGVVIPVPEDSSEAVLRFR